MSNDPVSILVKMDSHVLVDILSIEAVESWTNASAKVYMKSGALFYVKTDAESVLKIIEDEMRSSHGL